MSTDGLLAQTQEYQDLRQREVRIGVLLPLHNINGDGKRMVEYYRGVLMACDSLRANGISTDIRAWNVPEEADIDKILSDPYAANRDLMIGYYCCTRNSHCPHNVECRHSGCWDR